MDSSGWDFSERTRVKLGLARAGDTCVQADTWTRVKWHDQLCLSPGHSPQPPWTWPRTSWSSPSLSSSPWSPTSPVSTGAALTRSRSPQGSTSGASSPAPPWPGPSPWRLRWTIMNSPKFPLLKFDWKSYDIDFIRRSIKSFDTHIHQISLVGFILITHNLQEIDYKKLYLPQNVSLYDSTQIMDSNPIKTAIVVCNKLIREQVYAIIVSKPENGELSPASVSYTAGFYHIPVIGISSRDSAFSDKVSPHTHVDQLSLSRNESLKLSVLDCR